ncbi:MAG: hypothetical protein ABIO02_02025 [Patescibacteria group bacterium]
MARVVWTYTPIPTLTPTNTPTPTPQILLRGRVIDEGTTNPLQCSDLTANYVNGVIVQLYNSNCTTLLENKTTYYGPPSGGQNGYFDFTGQPLGQTYHICGVNESLSGGKTFTSADPDVPVNQCTPMAAGCGGRPCITYTNVNAPHNARLFVQAPTPTPIGVCALPTLISPADASCVNDPPILTASRTGTPDRIQFGVDTPTFSPPLAYLGYLLSPSTASDTYTGGTTPNTTYYWSAHTLSSTNACSASNWVTARSYTLDRQSPNMPTCSLSYIADPGGSGNYRISMSWTSVSDRSCKGMHATPYYTQLSSNDTFTNLIAGWSTIWGSGFSATTNGYFAPGNTFYGHVKARDGFGNETQYSSSCQITLPVDPAPIGTIDDPASCMNIHGFACDSSRFSTPITVKFYADGTETTGTYLGQSTANGTHAASTYYCGGFNRGYTYTGPTLAPLPNGSNVHEIYAYGLGINAAGGQNGSNSLLSNSPKIITCIGPTPTTPADTPTPIPSNTPTPKFTPIPTATPTTVPWTQLNGSSFQSTGKLTNIIPQSPLKYEDGTAGQPYFIIDNAPLQEAGVVTSNGLELGSQNPSAAVSSKTWKNTNYHPKAVNTTSFINYIMAKQSYKDVKTLNDIEPGKINIFTDKDITITNSGEAQLLYGTSNTPRMVIFKNSSLTINMGNLFSSDTFNPSKYSVVIIASRETSGGSAGTITFGPYVDAANGIFIADSVNTGSTTNKGLSIEGNLITNSLTNARRWTDNHKPSLYIITSPKMYLDTFKFLSKPTYEWTQLK